ATYRNKTKLMLGDGTGTGLPDAQGLQVAVRAHANFAEFVPLTLIILACLVHEDVNQIFFLILCATLVLGRILHPIGIRILTPNVPRAVGAMLTWAVLLIASVATIVLAL
ncbi:MAG TPA: MAPEG family protein, partial [Acidocella sp.]|nr:MAPEG family protein [Acidocella sp.]